MIETQWRQMNDRYDVSPDGYVRLRESSGAGPAGRLLLPCWGGGEAVYLIRPPKSRTLRGATSVTIPAADLVRETWGADPEKITKRVMESMRVKIQAHNAGLFPDAPKPRKSSGNGGAPPSFMPCPWATPGKLEDTALPSEIDTWNCPEMDPLTNRQQNGVWVDMPVVRRRKKKSRAEPAAAPSKPEPLTAARLRDALREALPLAEACALGLSWLAGRIGADAAQLAHLCHSEGLTVFRNDIVFQGVTQPCVSVNKKLREWLV